MPIETHKNKVVILSGAGISAESGLQPIRDTNELWNNYSDDEVATPEAWEKNPQLVLEFYNACRKQAVSVQPNQAHLSIAQLEKKYEVVVITQNIDDLHERAGSSQVIHVHGELVKARSTLDNNLIYNIGGNSINLGDTCEKGSQLRPHIVWFGETVLHHQMVQKYMLRADKVLIVGTSLTVFPIAGLVYLATAYAQKIIVGLDMDNKPSNYIELNGTAVDVVPDIVEGWLLESG